MNICLKFTIHIFSDQSIIIENNTVCVQKIWNILLKEDFRKIWWGGLIHLKTSSLKTEIASFGQMRWEGLSEIWQKEPTENSLSVLVTKSPSVYSLTLIFMDMRQFQ